ncbi:MAG: hypothetical protein L3J31_03660 [Bacteroidales bacterium]|nr:hypothetical protein [Bacteroidales bacterium]MCF6341884.1 hypothetical protein [Bacteroidales bacterium]
MQTLLTKIKHAKITSREVFIHLRKNGELKRKQYLKYLKMQYRVAGDAYVILQSDYNRADGQPGKLNSHYNMKSAMPVNLAKSELSSMSCSFAEMTFLAEAWRFFQKEQMKEDSSRKLNIHVLTGFAGGAFSKGVIRANQGRSVPLNYGQTDPPPTNKSAFQANSLPQKTLVLSNEPGSQNLYCNNSNNSTPFCIQILKWTMEGQFHLN